MFNFGRKINFHWIGGILALINNLYLLGPPKRILIWTWEWREGDLQICQIEREFFIVGNITAI